MRSALRPATFFPRMDNNEETDVLGSNRTTTSHPHTGAEDPPRETNHWHRNTACVAALIHMDKGRFCRLYASHAFQATAHTETPSWQTVQHFIDTRREFRHGIGVTSVLRYQDLVSHASKAFMRLLRVVVIVERAHTGYRHLHSPPAARRSWHGLILERHNLFMRLHAS